MHVPPIASRTMSRYAYRYGLGIWGSRSVRGNSGLVRQIDLSPLPAQPPLAICSNFVNAAIHARTCLREDNGQLLVIRLGKSCRLPSIWPPARLSAHLLK